MRTVNLSSYKSSVDFGSGNASDDVPGNGSPPADLITYTTPVDAAVFSSRGAVLNPGGSGSYVYLSNTKGTSYAAGTPSISGVIVLRKWTSAAWD
jgi:hypothetical protein